MYLYFLNHKLMKHCMNCLLSWQRLNLSLFLELLRTTLRHFILKKDLLLTRAFYYREENSISFSNLQKKLLKYFLFDCFFFCFFFFQRTKHCDLHRCEKNIELKENSLPNAICDGVQFRTVNYELFE